MQMTSHACVATRLAAFVGIGIVWATSVTSAQMTRDPREHARTHVGPFYVTPTVELAEIGVETNVYNEPIGKSDLTSTLMPHADVWVPFGTRALVTASGTPTENRPTRPVSFAAPTIVEWSGEATKPCSGAPTDRCGLRPMRRE